MICRDREHHRVLRRRAGLTLVEVMAAVTLLTILMTGVYAFYDRMTTAVIDREFAQRATAVAVHRIEQLLGSGQEPDVVDMRGPSELDSDFFWEMTLTREVVGTEAPRPDLSNTVIRAEVRVDVDASLLEEQFKPVTMVRYIAHLHPRPGQAVAVPFAPVDTTPAWLEELKVQLGREPTMAETIQRMVELGLMEKDELDLFEGLEDSIGDTDDADDDSFDADDLLNDLDVDLNDDDVDGE